MESKKNPKADVSRNGSIYFAVGLALMLFLTYSTLNWKTYDKSDIDIGKLNLDDELDEETKKLVQNCLLLPANFCLSMIFFYNFCNILTQN